MINREVNEAFKSLGFFTRSYFFKGLSNLIAELFIISFFAEIVPTDGCSFASAADLSLRKLRGLWEVISGEKQVD